MRGSQSGEKMSQQRALGFGSLGHRVVPHAFSYSNIHAPPRIRHTTCRITPVADTGRLFCRQRGRSVK
jgi:hypothetical protein